MTDGAASKTVDRTLKLDSPDAATLSLLGGTLAIAH
jgi:hypothetical protein